MRLPSNPFYLLAALTLALGQQSANAQHHYCPCSEHHLADNTDAPDQHLRCHFSLELPSNLPPALDLEVMIEGEPVVLQLTKNQVFGPNTRFLIAGPGGTMTEVDPGPDCSYLGQVKGNSDILVSVILSKDGLLATIARPDAPTLTIEPCYATEDPTDHVLLEARQLGETSSESTVATEKSSNSDFSSPAKVAARSLKSPKRLNNNKDRSASTATLRPSRRIEVREYEVGVEIGSRAFEGSYGKNEQRARSVAAGIAGNMDLRYLRGAGIKHRIGTVIIRTDPATDPLRDRVRTNALSGLNAFRDYWNRNPDEVGRSHDLAVYHVKHSPSGRAYINAVGGGNRYAVSCSNGATSWADGTLVHEFGHSWNLRHNNDRPISVYSYGPDNAPPSRFYEAKPRDNNGRSSAGGSHTYVSVMNGDGKHNIKRLSSEEALTVIAAATGSKKRFGDVVTDLDPINPFGLMDRATTNGQPIRIDVIANDYDANNDVLDVELLDTVSHRGATISLSKGTGPGGRCEILYTPQANTNGSDFFHYKVYDTTGRSNFGAVYVTNEGPIRVDTSLTKFSYDLGPSNGPTQANFAALSNEVSGDISWSGDVRALDRGEKQGVNNINRDFVYSNGPATFSHKVQNGLWTVTLNMGDSNKARDNMMISAENGTKVQRGIGGNSSEFPYAGFDVPVADGMLDLTFSDEGGADPEWVVNRLTLTLKQATTDGDNDGLLDSWEVRFFGNLTSTSGLPTEDADRDGLSDVQEFAEQTDPTKSDTDGDGLSDNEELVRLGTNPTLADSDSDGFDDGTELLFRTNPSSDEEKPDPKGLVAYYPFDEGAGDQAASVIGVGLDASRTQGTITWTTDNQRVGSGCLDLNGSASLLAASPLSEDTEAFSISVWINPNTDGGFKGVYVGRDSPGNWGVNVKKERIDARFATPAGSSFGAESPEGSVKADGGWYHVAQTWSTNGTTTSGKVYLNGKLVYEGDGGRPNFTLPTEGFLIGDDNCCGGREFNGQIDDLMVFNRVLSPEEVTEINALASSGKTALSAFAPPAKPDQAPQPVNLTVDSSTGDASFTFETVLRVRYRISTSTNLIDWKEIDVVTGDGELLEINQQKAQADEGFLFYRIEQL